MRLIGDCLNNIYGGESNRHVLSLFLESYINYLDLKRGISCHRYYELPSSVEMFKLGLLSAGFSAILGREVLLQEGDATYSIHDVFKQTYVMKPPGYRPPSPKPVHLVQPRFQIFVRGNFGFGYSLTLQVTEEHSVLQMKLQIQEKVKIALTQFDLMFDNKRLDDDRTVKDYGLQPGSTIYFAHRLTGGGGPLTVSTDELAPEFDYDFTYAKDDGKQYIRGGFVYQRPYGWKREWPVSYHGTDMSSAEKIVKEGYKVGPGAKYGPGIYTSPSLEMVERRYARQFDHDGKRYKIAFQNRVNPDRNGHLKIINASITGVGADYWVSPIEDDVRPYGLLFREVPKTVSQPQYQPQSQSQSQSQPCSLQ